MRCGQVGELLFEQSNLGGETLGSLARQLTLRLGALKGGQRRLCSRSAIFEDQLSLVEERAERCGPLLRRLQLVGECGGVALFFDPHLPGRFALVIGGSQFDNQVVLLDSRKAFLERVVAGCDFGLLAEWTNLVLDLAENITNTGQVRLGSFELLERFSLLDAVLFDAGGLFEQAAPRFGISGEYGIDFALVDQCIGLAPDTGIEKQLVDVFEAASGLVDEILALAGLVGASRDCDFIEGERQGLVGIVDGERDFADPKGLASRRAREDDILRAIAAHGTRFLFAEDP